MAAMSMEGSEMYGSIYDLSVELMLDLVHERQRELRESAERNRLAGAFRRPRKAATRPGQPRRQLEPVEHVR